MPKFHKMDFKFMGKIQGVWCKGVQCLVIGGFKKIRTIT